MFKILELKLINHPVLGEMYLEFTDEGEYKSKEYTSLIIGENGTGKSQILSSIIEIIVFLRQYIEDKKNRSNKLKFDFEITLALNGKKNKIISKNINASEEILKKIVPNKLISNSYTFNDPFPMRSEASYAYCGLKTTTNNIFLNRPFQDTYNNFVKIINSGSETLNLLNELFLELGISKTIKAVYQTRRNNKLLSSPTLIRLIKSINTNINENNILNFQSFLSNKLVKNAKSRRYQDDKIVKLLEDKKRLKHLLVYLKANIEKPSQNKEKKGGNEFPLKLEFEYNWDNELENVFNNEFINHIDVYESLSDLDILSFSEMQVKKQNFFSSEKMSSGEFHMLHLICMLIVNIEQNSLVLLDEPEISLHLGWQQRFFKFLEPIREKYPTTQFIIATHSHFLVSDLKKQNSTIIILKRIIDNKVIVKKLPKDTETYGWSAEQIMLEVFTLYSDRNYYVGDLIQKTVTEISKTNPNKKDLNFYLNELKQFPKLNFKKDDPLLPVIKKLLTYEVED